MRDSQRSKLYKAETAFRKLELKSPLSDNPLKTVTDAQIYVDEVLRRAWFRKRWGTRLIRVEGGRGGGKAYGSYLITLGVWARQEAVILHEIAHCVAPYRVKHGPEFAGIYILLVDRMFGKEAGQTLRKIYKEHGVRYSFKAVPKPRYRTTV